MLNFSCYKMCSCDEDTMKYYLDNRIMHDDRFYLSKMKNLMGKNIFL